MHSWSQVIGSRDNCQTWGWAAAPGDGLRPLPCEPSGNGIIASNNVTKGSVIIVSCNSSEYISACIQALRAACDWKIIVVDNASTDTSVEAAKGAAPSLCILQNTENRGFAAAVNQGFQFAEGETCVLLNPDTVAQEHSLDKLAEALSQYQVGAVGGALTLHEGSPERGFTVRRLPTLASMAAEVLLLNRVWPGNPWNRRYRCLDLDYTRPHEVEQPAGACLAVRKQAWEQIGGFDESFFPVWFDDVDFCRRLRQQGWKIRYCSDAPFFHVGGHSVHQLSFSQRQAFWYRNLLHYFAKHHSRAELGTLRLAVVGGLLLRSLLALLGFRPPGVSGREAVSAYVGAAWCHAILGRDLR